MGRVLSDPPTLRSVMEAEAERSGPSPPTCSHPTWDKVCVRDKGAGRSRRQPEDGGTQNTLLLPIIRVRILDGE